MQSSVYAANSHTIPTLYHIITLLVMVRVYFETLTIPPSMNHVGFVGPSMFACVPFAGTRYRGIEPPCDLSESNRLQIVKERKSLAAG